MAVTTDKLTRVIAETEQFLSIAKATQLRLETGAYVSFGCKETSNVRRASMDLTNALVEIRW